MRRAARAPSRAPPHPPACAKAIAGGASLLVAIEQTPLDQQLAEEVTLAGARQPYVAPRVKGLTIAIELSVPSWPKDLMRSSKSGALGDIARRVR